MISLTKEQALELIKLAEERQKCLCAQHDRDLQESMSIYRELSIKINEILMTDKTLEQMSVDELFVILGAEYARYCAPSTTLNRSIHQDIILIIQEEIKRRCGDG